MVDHERLMAMLTRLKLTAIRDQLDCLLDQAAREELTLRETLAFLCEREIAGKDERRTPMGLSIAHFPQVATLAGFDFAAQPSIDEARSGSSPPVAVLPAARTCSCSVPPGWARRTWPSPWGARRSRRATARSSCRHRPWWQASPGRTHKGGWRSGSHTSPSRSSSWSTNWGICPSNPTPRISFFQLVTRRYERGSLLITSNRTVSEWGTVFGDAIAATAILDRLLHHSHVITIRGESHRLKEKRRAGVLLQRHPSAHLSTVHQPA